MLANIKWDVKVETPYQTYQIRRKKFLTDLLAALDRLERKELIRHVYQNAGRYCAIGTLGIERSYWYEMDARLPCEIVELNDAFVGKPAERYTYMRNWIKAQLEE